MSQNTVAVLWENIYNSEGGVVIEVKKDKLEMIKRKLSAYKFRMLKGEGEDGGDPIRLKTTLLEDRGKEGTVIVRMELVMPGDIPLDDDFQFLGRTFDARD